MDLVRTLAVLVLSVATLACHRSASDASRVTNLGVSALDVEIEGDLLVANVVEGPDQDLNGDGDFHDAFIEVFDLARGTRSRLPEVALCGFELGAGYVAFAGNESSSGGDRNGDGDVLDDVLHVHDTRDGTTRNVGLAVRIAGLDRKAFLAQEGALVAFVVSEADQGEDLDGDGELTHDLAYAYRADLDSLVALELPCAVRPLVEGERVIVAVPESGLADRNGDGDAEDVVLACWDARTRVTRNLERAIRTWNGDVVQFGIEGPLLAFAVPEAEQGTDENEDGDLDDLLVEIRDLDSGTVVATDLPAGHVSVGGGLAGLVVPETISSDPIGVDRNGDGDVLDMVVYFHDWLTGTRVNTGVAIGSWLSFAAAPVYSGRRSAFAAPETVDRNGDGDTSDLELHVFDARTGLTEATGIVVWHESGIDLDDGHLACAALADDDLVPLVLDLASGARTTLASSIKRLELAEGRVHFSVFEAHDGADLNGDGDREDIVQRTHDIGSGRTFDTHLATSSNDGFPARIYSGGGRMAWHVPESSQGRDLNGDGDLTDWPLHVVSLP